MLLIELINVLNVVALAVSVHHFWILNNLLQYITWTVPMRALPPHQLISSLIGRKEEKNGSRRKISNKHKQNIKKRIKNRTRSQWPL